MNGNKVVIEEEDTKSYVANIRSIDSENNIEKYKEEANDKIEKLLDTGS